MGGRRVKFHGFETKVLYSDASFRFDHDLDESVLAMLGWYEHAGLKKHKKYQKNSK